MQWSLFGVSGRRLHTGTLEQCRIRMASVLECYVQEGHSVERLTCDYDYAVIRFAGDEENYGTVCIQAALY